MVVKILPDKTISVVIFIKNSESWINQTLLAHLIFQRRKSGSLEKYRFSNLRLE